MKTTVQADGNIWVWHFHHDILAERLARGMQGYHKRVRDIKRNKPLLEQPRRLRMFKVIEGRLPEGVVVGWDNVTRFAGLAQSRGLTIKEIAEVKAMYRREVPQSKWSDRYGHIVFPRENYW